MGARKGAWVFIVNPAAGDGYAASCVGKIRDLARAHGVDAEIRLTEGRGHATELAREGLRAGFDHIIGVGGDGTLSELVQGLGAGSGATFGVVPAGTGNDFIHVLGFPGRFTGADWEALFAGHTIDMDVGRCNGRLFINGMGLGFDAQVASENYRLDGGGGEVARGGGKIKYAWHMLKTILTYQARVMRLTIEGATEERTCLLNTIGNGRRFAGGLEVTPKAVANDGLIDLCMMAELSVPRRFKQLVSVIRKTHVGDPAVRYHQVSSVTLEFDEEVPAHLDGELIRASRFEIDVAPGGLRVIYNPGGPHYFRTSTPPGGRQEKIAA